MTAWLVARLCGVKCTCGRRLEVATSDACRALNHGRSL